MKRSESNRSRRGEIAELKGHRSPRLLLQMEAAHSQLTVYRSSASVPGQRMTVGFNGAKSQRAASGLTKSFLYVNLTKPYPSVIGSEMIFEH